MKLLNELKNEIQDTREMIKRNIENGTYKSKEEKQEQELIYLGSYNALTSILQVIRDIEEREKGKQNDKI